MKPSSSPTALWRRNLWILFFSQLTTMIGFSSIFPFLPFYVQSLGSVWGLSMELLVGLVFSLQAFTMMLISPLWGLLSDRYGRKLMVVRAAIGGSLLFVLMAFARSAEELVLLRGVQGFVTGTVGAANALVAASVPKKHMGYAMGVLQMGLGVGLGVGPLVGGVMADLFGYRSAFYVTGALLLFSGLLVQFWVKENFEKPTPSSHLKTGLISKGYRVLRARGVALVLTLRFSNQLGRMIFLPVLPLFVQDLAARTGAVNSFTGLIVGTTSAAMTTSAIFLGRLGDRVGHRRIVIGAALLCCLSLALQSLVSNGWQLLILQALFGVGFGGVVPGISALLSGLTASDEAGVVYGLDNSISSAARTISPMLGVWIAMAFGIRFVFGAGALLYLGAGLLALARLPRT